MPRVRPEDPTGGSRTMNDARAMGPGENETAGARGRTSAAGPGGVIHAFVEMSELRRIMGCLAAIEVLRLILETDATLGV